MKQKDFIRKQRNLLKRHCLIVNMDMKNPVGYQATR